MKFMYFIAITDYIIIFLDFLDWLCYNGEYFYKYFKRIKVKWILPTMSFK